MPSKLREGRRILWATALLILVGALGACWFPLGIRHHTQAPAAMPAPVHDVAPIRLARPDALIVSTSLRDLPRDLLQVPLLKTMLTEHFVFYYQQNSRLLGIEGTLRRIAYEHHLSLHDDVIALLLNRPADIAFWRGRNGGLSHWMIDTSGEAWLPWLKLAARMANQDPAIALAGQLPLPDGSTTPVYSFDYGRSRPIYFAGANGHLVIFSDHDMFTGDRFGDQADRAVFWRALFAHARQQSPLRSHFGLANFKGKHTLMIEAAAISFGYQHFTPSIKALRFDFDGQRWASYLQLAPHSAGRFRNAAVWQALPDHPALCASAPVDWSRLQPALERLAKLDQRIKPGITQAFGEQSAVCWFANGSIYTPLVLVGFHGGAAWDSTLTALFVDGIGNSWPRYRHAAKTQHSDAAPAIAGAAHVWQDKVATDYGTYPMTLARAGGWLVFSPDAEAVRNTIATINHQRPAVADHFAPQTTSVIATVTPATLAKLLETAVEGDLTAQQQPLFHTVASERLLPRLHAAAKFPAYVLTLPQVQDSAQRTWQPVIWHSLSAQP